MASLYAFGWVRSSKLQDSTQLPTPTLQIHCTIVATLVDLTILYPTPTSNMTRSFIVPLDLLETPKQCERWIRKNLLESMRFVIVTSEIDNPKKLLTELIWSMKNAWEAGVKCSGVVEMNVMLVSTLDVRRIVVKSWLKTSVSNFTVGDEEGRCSCCSCCAVCLDELEENSAVVKLRCQHVFHSQCIRDWLHRKTTCPSCRNPLNIRFKFWVHMDKKSSFPIQLQSEVQKHLFHTSTEVEPLNGEKQNEPMNPVVPGFSAVKGSEHALTEPEEEEEYPVDGIGGSLIIYDILTAIIYMKKRRSATKKKDQSKTINRKSRKAEMAQSSTYKSKSRTILAVTIFYRARLESIREVNNY